MASNVQGDAVLRQQRLNRFRAPVNDERMIEFWRNATPADHAKAMIELSNYAQQLAKKRGIERSTADPMPALPKPRPEALTR